MNSEAMRFLPSIRSGVGGGIILDVNTYLASWTRGVFVKTFDPGIAGIALWKKKKKKKERKGSVSCPATE